MDGLIQAHIETLHAVDDDGDLTVHNAPYEGGRRPAPLLHLAWDGESYAARFRGDVGEAVRERVLALVKQQWPFPSEKGPPEKERYVDILGGSGRRGSGPAYVVNDLGLSCSDAVSVDSSNAQVLRAHFRQWIEALDACQPFTAVVVDGVAVSVCHTVRRSRHGIEAGIDTAEEHRRRGYGRCAVAAWSSMVEQEGGLGFYSTGWPNRASVGLASSLGLMQFAVEFSVS